MPHIAVFTDANFGGWHKHIFDSAPVLALVSGTSKIEIDADFINAISSIVIFSGNWQFFRDANFESPVDGVFGPGIYPFVGDFGLPNDAINSMQSVSIEATVTGQPLDNHAILFQNANFHGSHQHVFQPVADLAGSGFSGITSSIAVELGNWSFFSGTQFAGSYPEDPVFGPGVYPWVETAGLANDSIASLQPSTLPATISNAFDHEVVLCLIAEFFGPHKHVVAAEPNLNASDDNSFNDSVHSLAILSGEWSFYADAGFVALYYPAPATPGVFPDVSALHIVPGDMSSLRPAVPDQVTAGQPVTGELILFADENFSGQHRHVLNAEPDLGAGSAGFNDTVSSLAIVSGNWTFFRNANFDDAYPVVLGPGLYPSVTAVSIANDDMSSLSVTSDAATVTGTPLDSHLILFQNAAFRGDHQHILQATADLGGFDGITSSITVMSGVWETFAGPDFADPFPPLLGSGPFPSVTAVGIGNDAVRSVTPVAGIAPTTDAVLLGHVLLFKDANLRGGHKHVFAPEPNLNASDDNSFNDAVSSIAVLRGDWFTYRDAGFQLPYDVTLGPGVFPWVVDAGIANDAISSLQIAQQRLGFTGQATINVASGSLPNTVTDDLSMSFLYDPATRHIRVETPFLDLSLDGLATIHYDTSAIGLFPSDGEVTVPDMMITLSSLLGSQDATISFATGTATSPTGRYTVTGSPADAAGNCVLVTAGQVADDDFSIALAGTFTPRPA